MTWIDFVEKHTYLRGRAEALIFAYLVAEFGIMGLDIAEPFLPYALRLGLFLPVIPIVFWLEYRLERRDH